MTYNEKKSLYESIMKEVAKTVKHKINEVDNSMLYESSYQDLTDLIDSASIRNGIDNLLAENNSKFLYILADASSSIKLQVYELLLPIIKHTIGYNYKAKLSPFTSKLAPAIDIDNSEEEISNHIYKFSGGTEIVDVLKEAATKTKAPIVMITDSLKYEDLSSIDKSIFNRTFFIVLEDYEESARNLQKNGCSPKHITMARYNISKLKSIISNGGSLI